MPAATAIDAGGEPGGVPGPSSRSAATTAIAAGATAAGAAPLNVAVDSSSTLLQARFSARIRRALASQS